MSADLIEVFKNLKGFENVDPERFFRVVGDDGRRGHVLQVVQEKEQIGCWAIQVCESGVRGVEWVG